MRVSKILLLQLIVILSLQVACAGGSKKPTRYYLIDPVSYDSSDIKAVRPLRIEIIDLNVPQYLERFHIAIRTSESQLTYSEFNQWGESLRKNLMRTLSRNLATLLSTIDIATPLNRTVSTPDYRVQIYIDQFEQDSDNTVKLVARWQLSTLKAEQPAGIYAAELQSQQQIVEQDYVQMVAAMRDLFAQLSEQIAISIVEQEN